jgi:DinB superfamily
VAEVAADILALENAFDAAERDARELTAGLSPEDGVWRAAQGTWSVSECLDHLATANRVYLAPMSAAALGARGRGRVRRGPAVPGMIGGWFVRTMEPPVSPRFRMRAPRTIVPRAAPPLADAFDAFVTSQAAVREFLRAYADIDLADVRFVNPFVRGVRFSLATGLQVIAAHERRHLWQAWRVRRAIDRPQMP